MGRKATGGLGGQTLNLSIPVAPYFLDKGLRTGLGMRPGLMEIELSFIELKALAQGSM